MNPWQETEREYTYKRNYTKEPVDKILIFTVLILLGLAVESLLIIFT